MPLDHDGRALLAALQADFGSDFYAEVPDQTGLDRAGQVEVTIDCACRVVGLSVLDVDAVRRPPLLAAAVIEAFAEADDARAIHSAQHSPHGADLVSEGAALLRGEIELQTDPRSEAQKQRVRLGGGTSHSAYRVGRSANNYLGVRIGADGAPVDVDVDELWLTAVQPERLRAALLEAFSEADHPTDLERI